MPDLKPHEQRVVAEYKELRERHAKLYAFIASDTFITLPEEDRELLVIQENLMDALSFVLARRIRRFTAAGVTAAQPTEPDEDEQWAVDRGADLLEHYAAYIHRVKPEDIEAHPYLPELEQVAKDLRALSKRMSAPGVTRLDAETFPPTDAYAR